MKTEIPETLLSKLGPEMKMDVHWIDVHCKNDEKYFGLIVRGGKYISGFKTDVNGEGRLPFASNEIKNLRRHTYLKWWPFW